MKVGRPSRTTSALFLALAAVSLFAACRRRKVEVNDIVPSVSFNRSRAPLGSALEITYTWTVEPTAKKLATEHRAFVHFLDTGKVTLFDDDHVPVPSVTQWEPGKTYSYTRTKFIPIYPYVGDVEVREGLYPVGGGERAVLKGEDAGMREFRAGKLELLPQTENIFLVYKEGWHNPEASPQNPSLERTWTKKNAVVSFKNPKKDVIVYLEADTNSKAFDLPPVLTVSLAGKTGLVVPIPNSEVFLKKIRVKAADLGNEDWVDLRLDMNQSFVPKLKGVNTNDDRELGLLVYHLYVAEADKLGTVPGVVDAGPVTVSLPVPSPAATGKPGAATKSPAPGRSLAAPGAGPSAKPGAAPTAGASARPSAAPRPAAPSPRPSPTP